MGDGIALRINISPGVPMLYDMGGPFITEDYINASCLRCIIELNTELYAIMLSQANWTMGNELKAAVELLSMQAQAQCMHMYMHVS